MLNNCLLTGNLGADPEVFYSSEGDPIGDYHRAGMRHFGTLPLLTAAYPSPMFRHYNLYSKGRGTL